ncbi:MAG: sigma-54 dependent transcriptional regulator [Pirellulaceae bacterium]
MASNTDQPSQEAQPPAIRILIVDNDKAHAQAMVESLQRDGYECTMSTSGPAGKKQIQEGDYDIVITDLVMNEVDGMEVLSTAVDVLPDAQVVMVTGHASVPLAVEAMQLGAYNFLEKPITPRRLRAVVKRAVEAVLMRRDNLELNQRLDEKFGFEGIIFASEEMKQVIDQVRRVALTDATVLITGESGTGKELIAQAIHQNSPRKGKRLVPINCAAVAENLVESELFGHVKGAYTDAHADRTGAFEYAHGGSLFLDEVGDMPLATQIKLLRVLEDHLITRVGDNQPIHVNVRLVSATNRSLEEAITNGTFREDLYYRLKVVTIALPSLRQRRDDIIPLVDHFRRSLASHHDKSIKAVTPAVTKKLYQHDWPGNVRQLRNTVESMVVLDTDGVLDMDDLPPDLADGEAVVSSSADGPVELIGQPLTEIEKWAYEQTLRLAGGNREEVARILGIGARTVYRKLKEYDL